MLRGLRRIRGEKGFTLIEVMVVVVILGILAALSIPLYSGNVRKGKIAEALLAISDIKHGVMTYYQKNGTFSIAADADAISDKYGISVDAGKWTYNVAASGNIVATASSVGSGLDGGTITATPAFNTNGSISWSITATDPIKQGEVS